MRSIVIIAGLVACIVLVVSWTNALDDLPEVKRLGYSGDDYIISPEDVTEQRGQVNSTYGLWLFLIIGVTGGLFYIANEKDKKAKELKAWYENEGKKETEELLKEDNANSHVGKEENSKIPAKKEIIECPYCLEDIYAGAKKCKHCKTVLYESS